MNLGEKNAFARQSEDGVRLLKVLTGKRLADGSLIPRERTEIAQ
jgi:hypothetical protein